MRLLPLLNARLSEPPILSLEGSSFEFFRV